jgi:acyl-CoA reductase-like NAD-dependent aldehyde dehydrogenase
MDTQQLDHYIEVLQTNKERWLKEVTIQERIRLLSKAIEGMMNVSERLVERAVQAKKIPLGSPAVSEEWLGGPTVTIRTLRLLKESLKDIARFGHPQLKTSKVRTRANGQVVAEVFPTSAYDSLLFQGFRAEVWMQEGVKKEQLFQSMAELYRGEITEPKVALVLGAGNVASIAPLDVVYKLFVEGQVTLLKLNPVNDYLGPFIEEAFQDMIREGVLRICYGGGDVGAYLCKHEGIDEIHITGSHHTHDVIVYGPGEEGQKRKAENKPLLNKRITSELGNVSPIIIVPGNWTDADLQFHAENILSQMGNNAGFNCNAAKLLVMHEEWPLKDAFLEKLQQVMKGHPTRVAYYPGAEDRYQQFVDAHPEAVSFGRDGEDHLPWTLIPGIDSNNKDDICFQEESFCCVTAQTSLSATNAKEFLEKAVDFCNDTLLGTLNCCVIIHPENVKALGPYFEDAVADLKYGSVVINHWPALSYGLGCTTWGAFPGHTYDDIQSGIGVVHNSFLFDKPEKSVIFGPFRIFPKPPWFITHRSSDKMAKYLTEFEADPSPFRLPGVLWNAIKS